MKVTHHANERIRERVGIPKSSVEKSAKTALEKGLEHCETSGQLNKFISALYLKGKGKCGKIRIWNNHVWMFTSDDVLITTMPLSHDLQKIAEKQMKRRT